MNFSDQFFAFWYYNIPNYVLAAVMYTLLGQFLLGLFVPEEWENYIWRGFQRVTAPVLRCVRMITPLAISERLLLLIGAYWILVLRGVFTLAMLGAGLTPPVGGGGGGG